MVSVADDGCRTMGSLPSRRKQKQEKHQRFKKIIYLIDFHVIFVECVDNRKSRCREMQLMEKERKEEKK